MTHTVIGVGWLQRDGDEWRGEVMLSGCIRMPMRGALSQRDGKASLAVELLLPSILEGLADANPVDHG